MAPVFASQKMGVLDIADAYGWREQAMFSPPKLGLSYPYDAPTGDVALLYFPYADFLGQSLPGGEILRAVTLCGSSLSTLIAQNARLWNYAPPPSDAPTTTVAARWLGFAVNRISQTLRLFDCRFNLFHHLRVIQLFISVTMHFFAMLRNLFKQLLLGFALSNKVASYTYILTSELECHLLPPFLDKI